MRPAAPGDGEAKRAGSALLDGALPRLGLAVVVSLAVHAMLLLTVRFGEPGTSGDQARGAIRARLQVERPDPESGRSEAAPTPVDPQRAARADPGPPLAPPADRATDPPAPAAHATASGAPGPGGLPLPPLPDYLPLSALDQPPRPIDSVQLAYPPGASAQGLAGRVTLQLHIGATGSVDRAAVVAARPPGHFEEAALAAFRDLRFEPGRKDGRPVASRVRITVAFEPGQAESPQETSRVDPRR